MQESAREARYAQQHAAATGYRDKWLSNHYNTQTDVNDALLLAHIKV